VRVSRKGGWTMFTRVLLQRIVWEGVMSNRRRECHATSSVHSADNSAIEDALATPAVSVESGFEASGEVSGQKA